MLQNVEQLRGVNTSARHCSHAMYFSVVQKGVVLNTQKNHTKYNLEPLNACVQVLPLERTVIK